MLEVIIFTLDNSLLERLFMQMMIYLLHLRNESPVSIIIIIMIITNITIIVSLKLQYSTKVEYVLYVR